jgi:hypothetical protein
MSLALCADSVYQGSLNSVTDFSIIAAGGRQGSITTSGTRSNNDSLEDLPCVRPHYPRMRFLVDRPPTTICLEHTLSVSFLLAMELNHFRDRLNNTNTRRPCFCMHIALVPNASYEVHFVSRTEVTSPLVPPLQRHYLPLRISA